MSIRDREANQKRCEQLVAKLVKRLDLGWLRVNHAYTTAREEDAASRICCRAVADWEYRQVSFIWTLAIASSVPDSELLEIAVHEIVHALNAPLYKSLTDAQQQRLHEVNELSTENMSRVILHLLEKSK
jgi:hypothetical protein